MYVHRTHQTHWRLGLRPTQAHAKACLHTYTYLNTACLDVVRAVGTAGEVAQVELDLVPAFVQPHRHGADERLDACRRLVIAGSEAPSQILVIHHLQRSEEGGGGKFGGWGFGEEERGGSCHGRGCDRHLYKRARVTMAATATTSPKAG